MENGKTVDNQKIICYMKNFTEKLYTNYKQQIHIERIFAKKISKYQEIMIFQSKLFGKILTLDGVIQITEKDHHPYSEMLTHVPTLSHNQIKKVALNTDYRVLIYNGGPFFFCYFFFGDFVYTHVYLNTSTRALFFLILFIYLFY